MKKYIAEFIGTFVLVAFGCGSAVAANSIFISMGSPLPIAFTTLLIAFAFGLSIVAMAYSIGNISGCHVNPAVSLGMLITGRMNVKDFVGYLVGQFLGAVVAALFLMLVFGGREALGANGYGASSAVGTSMMTAVGLEIVMTFVFVLVVLGVTSKKEFAPVAGLVIGLSLTMIHIFGIPFTGTSVNPARSFGPAVVSGGDALGQLPVFIIAPLIGGALAAVVVRFLFTEISAEVQEENGEEYEEAYDVIPGEMAEDKPEEPVVEFTEEVFEKSDTEDSTVLADTEEPADVQEEEPLEEAAVETEAVMEDASIELAEEAPEVQVEEPKAEEETSVAASDGNEFDETYELMKENRGKRKHHSEQRHQEAEEEKTSEEAPVEEAQPVEETNAEEAPVEESTQEEPEEKAAEDTEAEVTAEEQPVEQAAEEEEAPAEEPAEETPAEELAEEESGEQPAEETPAEEPAEEESGEQPADAAAPEEEQPSTEEESGEEKSEEEKSEEESVGLKQPKSHRSKKRRKKNPKHAK